MCIACERKSKRIGLPKHSMEKVKFWANRAVRGLAWPLFRDKRINVAIEAHISRILRSRTHREKSSEV